MTEFPSVSKDRVRDYWNSRPCNVRHSTLPVGSREYFEAVAERKYFVEYHIPEFADFDRWRGKRVLEVGCGLGTATVSFALAGAEVTAVDMSTESLALARKNAETRGVADRVTFLEADAEELSKYVNPEPYDLVYSFGVIHHTPHPERAIREMRRFLAPGGTLKLMVYSRWSAKVMRIVLEDGHGRFWDHAELVANASEAQSGCPVTYTYSRRSGRRFVEAAGFAVDDVHADHIFPYRIPDYVQYRYVKRFPMNVLPYRATRALEHALGWHLCISAHAV